MSSLLVSTLAALISEKPRQLVSFIEINVFEDKGDFDAVPRRSISYWKGGDDLE